MLFTKTGGMVSLGPPVGVTTLAQRGNNSKTIPVADNKKITLFNSIGL
jgi:hypothetical protein